jgi:hypothetical protein
MKRKMLILSVAMLVVDGCTSKTPNAGLLNDPVATSASQRKLSPTPASQGAAQIKVSTEPVRIQPIEPTTTTAAAATTTLKRVAPLTPIVMGVEQPAANIAGLVDDVTNYYSGTREALLGIGDVTPVRFVAMVVPGSAYETGWRTYVAKANNEHHLFRLASNPVWEIKIGSVVPVNETTVNVTTCDANNLVEYTTSNGGETIIEETLTTHIRIDQYMLIDGHWKPANVVGAVQKYVGRNACETFTN